SAEAEQPGACQCRLELRQRGVPDQGDRRPVVQPGTPQRAVVEVEAQPADQVQGRARGGAQPGHVPRARGHLRLQEGHVRPRTSLPRWGAARHASSLATSSPSTSVRRKSRPWKRYVSRLWSSPSRYRIVACRSWTWTRSSTGKKPNSSVAPSVI